MGAARPAGGYNGNTYLTCFRLKFWRAGSRGGGLAPQPLRRAHVRPVKNGDERGQGDLGRGGDDDSGRCDTWIWLLPSGSHNTLGEQQGHVTGS
jgi:hypothetical protein